MIKTPYRQPGIIGKTEPPAKAKPHLNTRFLKSLFYLLLAVAILYFIFFSGFFRIRDVEVEGIKSPEIADYLHQTLIGKNILLLRTGAYLRTLSVKFPILEEARIERGLPYTVRMIVSERKQILIWCSKEKCWEVDNYGYAYQEIPRPSDKIVLNDESGMPIKSGDKIASVQFIRFFMQAIDEIEKLGITISEARIQETTFKVNFKTSEGWEAIFDSSASLKNQISALRQVLERNRNDIHEYVDLRVEGTAFIK